MDVTWRSQSGTFLSDSMTGGFIFWGSSLLWFEVVIPEYSPNEKIVWGVIMTHIFRNPLLNPPKKSRFASYANVLQDYKKE